MAKLGFRYCAVAALALGCAASANAWITVIYGTYTTVGGSTTNNGSYIYSDLMAGESASYSWGYTPTTFDGTFSLSNGVDTLDASFTASSVVSGGTYSFAGVWTETSEVGLPNVVPTGTISGSFDHFDAASGLLTNGDWGWDIVGQAVPEPTPCAVLGLGVIALLVRRKRTH